MELENKIWADISYLDELFYAEKHNIEQLHSTNKTRITVELMALDRWYEKSIKKLVKKYEIKTETSCI